MDDREKQIPAPKNWAMFEELCHLLFKAVWSDPLAHKNGRSGQPQHGVDIFGSPGGAYGRYHGVQCKGKEAQYGARATLAEVKTEIKKAEKFDPAVEHWIFATTAPIDGALQREVRKISRSRRKNGRFTVTVLGWGDIETLLCDHGDVLKAFYPELAFDVAKLLERLESMPRGSEVQELIESVRTLAQLNRSAPISASSWKAMEFVGGRDLGPALLGRPLGPADAAACPQLEEVSTVIAELHRAFFVRIVGEPGAGKSICAFQAGMRLAESGWSVVKLVDSRSSTIELTTHDAQARTVFIVDDAHLTDDAVLRAAEATAGSTRYLISTHNGLDGASSFRGSVVIDAKRAVRTIAAALRSRPDQIQEVVHRVDDQVGELMMLTPVEERINHAEESAAFPWQFCFILGGGWRGAKQAADAARASRADIVLAGAAIHQLASRDARPTFSQLTALFGVAGVDRERALHAFQWLVNERLLVDDQDLRSPHQRFAVVVLGQILAGQDKVGRESIGAMLRHVVSDTAFPIAGLRLLLHEFSFVDSGRYSWTHLIPSASLEVLIDRCWKASTPEERTFAALLLSELGRYNDEWPHRLFATDHHRISLIGAWMSDFVKPIGYGLSHLLHAIRNKDETLATQIIESADPSAIAAAISAATPETAAHLGNFVSALHLPRTSAWGQRVLREIEREKLIALATNWPTTEGAYGLAELCKSLVWPDEDLALTMVEAFIPVAQRLLSDDPVSAFRDLDDIAWHVLRILDPLGVYVGKFAPKSRHRKIAARMLEGLKPASLAKTLSTARVRDFQTVSFLLTFMSHASPNKFESTVAAMDWNKISETIGNHWRHIPHEAEVLVGVAYGAESVRPVLEQTIRSNLSRMAALPPRFALVAPSVAYDYVAQGGRIDLAGNDHVEWEFGTGVLSLFAMDRPDLLEAVLAPVEVSIARALSRPNASWYKDAADFVAVMAAAAPQSLGRVLGAIDVVGAEMGWTSALLADARPRRTAARLVEASLDRQDALGTLARTLRARFPKASIAKERRTNHSSRAKR